MNIPVIRILLLAALLAPASTFGQSATPTSIPTQHNEATVAQLQAEMASGSLTSEQLTQEYINRILALDQNGPGVNSVIELNPDALVMARGQAEPPITTFLRCGSLPPFASRCWSNISQTVGTAAV